jgi:hypothetical protein
MISIDKKNIWTDDDFLVLIKGALIMKHEQNLGV